LILTLGAESSIAAESGGRSKNLEFDGEVLEGMNKTPAIGVENLENTRKRGTNHLYKKRTSFQDESAAQAKEMGMMP
jgi:hypothetical protein